MAGIKIIQGFEYHHAGDICRGDCLVIYDLVIGVVPLRPFEVSVIIFIRFFDCLQAEFQYALRLIIIYIAVKRGLYVLSFAECADLQEICYAVRNTLCHVIRAVLLSAELVLEPFFAVNFRSIWFSPFFHVVSEIHREV